LEEVAGFEPAPPIKVVIYFQDSSITTLPNFHKINQGQQANSVVCLFLLIEVTLLFSTLKTGGNGRD